MFTLFDIYRKASGKVKTANLLGVHLEGPFISPAMKGAQPEAYVRCPSKREIDKIVSEAGDIVAICSMAPEIDGIEYAAKKLKDSGVALSIAHSNAIAADVFKAYEMGFDHVTHLYSNTPGIRKINQTVYAGIPEAVYLTDGISVELIGDGKHVPKEAMQMVLKLKGAEKVSLVTDAMRAAGQNVTESYLGKICPEARVIVEDGVAKLPDRTFYAGSIATSEIAFRNAVMNYDIPITNVTTMMSAAPAKFLGIDDRKGSIKVGYDADLVITDLSCNVENVFVGGRQVK
jgi:N-acetylglucosamine-6-phosphate deacetylase